jgi:hypothetical protein
MTDFKPTTYQFTKTQRINGWAKLIHLTKSGGADVSIERFLAKPLINIVPIERIENKPCNRPFLAIRKWKIWVMRNLYTGRQCYSININQIKPISYEPNNNI